MLIGTYCGRSVVASALVVLTTAHAQEGRPLVVVAVRPSGEGARLRSAFPQTPTPAVPILLPPNLTGSEPIVPDRLYHAMQFEHRGATVCLQGARGSYSSYGTGAPANAVRTKLLPHVAQKAMKHLQALGRRELDVGELGRESAVEEPCRSRLLRLTVGGPSFPGWCRIAPPSTTNETPFLISMCVSAPIDLTVQGNS